MNYDNAAPKIETIDFGPLTVNNIADIVRVNRQGRDVKTRVAQGINEITLDVFGEEVFTITPNTIGLTTRGERVVCACEVLLDNMLKHDVRQRDVAALYKMRLNELANYSLLPQGMSTGLKNRYPYRKMLIQHGRASAAMKGLNDSYNRHTSIQDKLIVRFGELVRAFASAMGRNEAVTIRQVWTGFDKQYEDGVISYYFDFWQFPKNLSLVAEIESDPVAPVAGIELDSDVANEHTLSVNQEIDFEDFPEYTPSFFIPTEYLAVMEAMSESGEDDIDAMLEYGINPLDINNANAAVKGIHGFDMFADGRITHKAASFLKGVAFSMKAYRTAMFGENMVVPKYPLSPGDEDFDVYNRLRLMDSKAQIESGNTTAFELEAVE